jgi:hypothetical protein
VGSQNIGRGIGRRDGATGLQITACKVFRGEMERPFTTGNRSFEVCFRGTVEIHERARVLQLYDQGMVAVDQLRANVKEGRRRNANTNGIDALLLNFTVHKMPHQSGQADKLVHAKGLPEGSIESDVSRVDCAVWEPND